MKGLIWFSVPLVLACFAESAFAWPEYVTCHTESNGVEFSKSERDAGLARSLTQTTCINDPRTLNAECYANLWCDDQSAYAPPMISCETESNGVSFNYASRDVSLSRQRVVSLCTADERTLNAECQTNVVCNNGYPVAPFISCKTDSNGIDFTHQDRDPRLARDLAISACTRDERTLNAECNANAWCSHQGPYPVRHSCTTQSNGLLFERDSLSEALARELVLRFCMNDNRTLNAECNANILCTPNGPDFEYPGFGGHTGFRRQEILR